MKKEVMKKEVIKKGTFLILTLAANFSGYVVPAYAELDADALVFEATPFSDEALQYARGMADIPVVSTITHLSNESDQTAFIGNNTLVSEMTGSNSMTQGALSGASGITTLIQNTGNQVVIQQSTLVNILFQQ